MLTVDERRVNPRHPKVGSRVSAPVIGAHRDFYPTDCCGSRAYALLPAMREQVATRLGPRLVDPALTLSGTTAALRARPIGVATAVGIAATTTGVPLGTVPVTLGTSATAPWSFASVAAGTSALLVTPASATGAVGVPVEVDITVAGGVGPRVVLPTGAFAVLADGTTWLIDDAPGFPGAQVRRLLTPWALATFPGAASRLVPGADDSVLALPLGPPAFPRDGALLHAPSGYFVMSAGVVRALSLGTMFNLGYQPYTAVDLGDGDIAALPQGGAVAGGRSPAVRTCARATRPARSSARRRASCCSVRSSARPRSRRWPPLLRFSTGTAPTPHCRSTCGGVVWPTASCGAPPTGASVSSAAASTGRSRRLVPRDSCCLRPSRRARQTWALTARSLHSGRWSIGARAGHRGGDGAGRSPAAQGFLGAGRLRHAGHPRSRARPAASLGGP